MTASDRDIPTTPVRTTGGWAWPAIVIGLITLQVGMSLTALALAVGDPTHAVVPDYYAKAVDWDAHMARVAASDALGWSAQLSVGAPAGPLDQQTATLTLTDADDAPLAADSVVADIFHHARAGHIDHVAFEPTDRPGVFQATVRMLRAGTWQVDFTARRGEDTFIRTLEKVVHGEDR